MKKVKDVIFGLAVFYLTLDAVFYFIEIAMNGLTSIGNYSLGGGYLFITMIAMSAVIIRYPLTAVIKNIIRLIKEEIKAAKKERQKKQNQRITNK